MAMRALGIRGSVVHAVDMEGTGYAETSQVEFTAAGTGAGYAETSQAEYSMAGTGAGYADTTQVEFSPPGTGLSYAFTVQVDYTTDAPPVTVSGAPPLQGDRLHTHWGLQGQLLRHWPFPRRK